MNQSMAQIERQTREAREAMRKVRHRQALRHFEITMEVSRAYMMQRLETKGKLRCELEGYDYDPRKNL